MAVVVLPEAPADEWDLSDWVEMMGNTKPGGAGAFSHQASEDTLVITLPGNQVRSCLRQVLGWAWADTAAPWLLHRPACPIQHPRYPWLWADAVSVEPHNPLGQVQGDATVKPKTAGVGWIDYAPENFGCYARMDVTVRFRGINWRQFTDADPIWQEYYVGKEWMRSFGPVSKSVQLDLISAEGANDAATLYFAEGTTAGSGTGPITGPEGGTPFNGSQFVRISRTNFKLVWKAVPVEYTCGEMAFSQDDIASFIMPYPERFARGLGRVNSAAFPGANSPYAAGTLLFTSYEETPYQLPVRTDSEFGLWACDYVMNFEHIDPTRDTSSVKNLGPSGGAPASKRGHYLFPYRPTLKFYYATAGTGGAAGTRGTYSGNPAIESQDFHDLFRHRGDTNYPIP